MLQHKRAVGDTLTKFAATLQSDGEPRDLTGKTVEFRMHDLYGAVKIAHGIATITSPLEGHVEYDFQPQDVNVADIYKGWFVILDMGNEADTYPNDNDGIEVTIFDPADSTVPPAPTIDIVALANAPSRTRTVEGTVEERSLHELIKADQYLKGVQAADTGVPWGLRIALTKPGGMVTPPRRSS